MKKNYYLLILCMITAFASKAQLIFNAGDVLNSDILVTSVDEDATYFWVGTNKGMARIEKAGKKYVIFTTANSPLKTDKITSVCCRKNGDVWIGTEKGIVRYDGYDFDVIDTRTSILPENFTVSLKEDSIGDLWVATKTKGLVKVHNERYYVYNQSNSNLFNNNVELLKKDKQGNVLAHFSNSDSLNVLAIVKK